ncbi:MAG: hypothetical protein AAB221_10470, partial [Bacteroidota bacterium]
SLAESIHKRSLVVIFSDMFDNSDQNTNELLSALQHFKHNKHEVILFHVVDKKKELDEADYAIIKIKKKSAQFQHLFFSKKRISLLP